MSDVNIDDYFVFDGVYPSLAVDDEVIYLLLKKLQAENAELKEQTNKEIRKVLCDIGTELENDTRINKKAMPFVRAIVINKIYDYPTPPEGE